MYWRISGSTAPKTLFLKSAKRFRPPGLWFLSLLLLFSPLFAACGHDGGAPAEKHSDDLSGVFSGNWGSLEFLEEKEVLVHFNKDRQWILRGRPNDTVYRYVFTLGSFGETAYGNADGFQLVHAGHPENLVFLCPEFPTAERLLLLPLADDAETGVFDK